MLINQSVRMLEYTEHFPIRLLSLPAEQQHMVQRLKKAKEQHKRSQTQAPSSRLCSSSNAHSQLSSYRVHTQEMDYYSTEKRYVPSSTLELNPAIHSKGFRERPRKLSILEEQPGRSRLTVLKQLMEKNGPFGVPISRKMPSDTIKLQAFEQKQPPSDAISKIYRSRLQRHRKEKELRNALIISRVKNTKDLNLLIRRISSSKKVPI